MPGPQGWPLRRAELAASADSDISRPGLRAKWLIENSCSFWLAALRAARGSPWDDPWPLRGLGRGAEGGDGRGGGRVGRGEAQRLEATLPRPLGPNMVSFPRLASWSLVPSSLGAEPGCSLGPQSLILPFPELGTPFTSLSLLAPFRVLFDMPLIQYICGESAVCQALC